MDRNDMHTKLDKLLDAMDRDEIHGKLDKLLDRLDDLSDRAEDTLDGLKDKAGDRLDDLKDKAEDAFNITDDDKAKLLTGAECAVDSVQRAACRGAGWVKGKLTDAQIAIENKKDEQD